MGCGLLNNFKFSKKFNFFYQNVLLGPDVYAVTDWIVKRNCEEDADAQQEQSLPLMKEKMPDVAKYTRSPTPLPPKQKSCMKPHTIHHKVAII